MSIYSRLDRIAADVEKLDKQVKSVSNAPQSQRTSVEGGSIDFNDADGNLKAIVGGQDDGGTTVNVIAGPTPPTPANYTVTVDHGSLTVHWDGDFEDGAVAPTDWARWTAYAQSGGFVVPDRTTSIGGTDSASGGEVTAGVLKGEWTVTLLAWSQAGKPSAMAEPVTVDVPGYGDIVLAEIDAAETNITNAREVLLDGQNTLGEKLDAADTALSGLETSLGELDETTLPALRSDLDAAEGRLSTAEGQITDAFGEIQDARSDAESYADGLKTQIDGTIDTARTELEGGITAAQARADAAFQDAAQASSDAAAARSHADDLVNSILDSGANIIPDGGFENPSSWTAVRGSVIESATARSGGRVLKMAPLNQSSYFYSREIPASPGRVWYVEVWVRRVVDTGTDSVRIYARHYAADGSFTSGYASATPDGPVSSIPGGSLPLGEWVLVKGYVTAPSGAVRTSLGGWVAAQQADYEYDDIRAVDVTVAAQALADASSAQSAAVAAQSTADQAQADATAAGTTASQALTSANTKNKVTRSTSRPPASYDGRVDDVWFTMSSMGSGGRVLFQEMWNGNTWVSVTIDSQVIAYLDAAKITTGYLNVATLIEAGAITADKILVGSGGNVIPWGQVTGGTTLSPHQISGSSSNVSAVLRPASASKGLPAHAAVTRTDTGGHSNSISFWSAPSRRLPVDEGTEYVFTATVYSDTESTVRLTMAGYAEDGSGTANSTGVFASSPIVTVGPQPVTITARGTVPAGSFYAIPFLRISGPSTVGFSMPDLRKSIGSTLIQDGAVTTGKLAANVLEVGNLKAGTAAIAEAVVAKIAAQTASIQQADVKNLFVTGTSSLSDVVAERIAADTAKFIELEVGNLVAGTGTMDTATIKKLFTDVVVASMAQAEQFIGENAILTGAVTAPKITASEELWAKIGEFVKIRAEHIEADAIDGMVITAPTIQSAKSGRRWVASTDSIRVIDDNDDVRTQLSPDGSTFKGEVEAETLVVNDGAEFKGNNTISQGAKLTLAAGVTDPTSPPVVQPYWDGVDVDLSWTTATLAGLAFDGTNYWTANSRGSWSSGDRTALRAMRLNPSTSKYDLYYLDSGGKSFNEVYGVTCIGSELFWLYRSGYNHRVLVTDLNCVKKREFEYPYEDAGHSATNPLVYKPGVGNDGTNVVIAQCTDAGDLIFRTYNKTTGAKINGVSTGENVASDIGGVYVGAGDFGSNHMVAARASNNSFIRYTMSGNRIDDGGWFSPDRQDNTGIVYVDGKFRSLDPEGTITEYGDTRTGDESQFWWACYAWAGDFDGNGITETWSRPSPPKRFTWPRRAKLKILGQPLPDGVQMVLPALARKETVPVRTDFHSPTWTYVEGKSEAHYDTLPTGWEAQPSPRDNNNFPDAEPSTLETTNKQFSVKGDGSGRWGPLTFFPNGSWSGAVVSGQVVITSSAANSTTSVEVTFPPGRFTNIPEVTTTVYSNSPRDVSVGVRDVSATSFTINMFSTATGPRRIAWIAFDQGA